MASSLGYCSFLFFIDFIIKPQKYCCRNEDPDSVCVKIHVTTTHSFILLKFPLKNVASDIGLTLYSTIVLSHAFVLVANIPLETQ